MPDLRQTRKKIKIALGSLLALDVVTTIVLFSPLVGSTESRRAELNQLWTDLQAKTRQVEPLNHLDQKVVAANKQIGEFYKKRFPAQESQILTELGKMASKAGVTIEAGKYHPGEGEIDHLMPVEIDANMNGNYVQLANFINSLERDDLFFIINSVELAGEQKGPISLHMKLETYLKVGS